METLRRALAGLTMVLALSLEGGMVLGRRWVPVVAVAAPAAMPELAARPSLPAPVWAPLSEPAAGPASPPAERLEVVLQRPRWHRVAARWHRVPATVPAVVPPALPDQVRAEIAIRASVRSLLPLARACYNDGLRRDPRLAGAATFRLRTDRFAHVSSVSAEQSLPYGAGLVACLSRALRRAALPRAAAEMEIEVPFLLQPEPETLAQR